MGSAFEAELTKRTSTCYLVLPCIVQLGAQLGEGGVLSERGSFNNADTILFIYFLFSDVCTDVFMVCILAAMA